MKALRFHSKQNLRVDSIPPPVALGAKDVLVRNSFPGPSGSDLHAGQTGRGDPIDRRPRTGGHARGYTGYVLEVGSEVTSIRPGDRVAIQPLITPADEFFRRSGLGQLADGLAVVGLSWPWGEVANQSIVPEENVAPLPESMPDKEAMIEPASMIVHTIMGRIGAGNSVLVVGGGPTGALACLAACAAGATTILVSEGNAARRKRVMDLGIATQVFDPASPSAAEAIESHTEGGRGVDVTIECVGSDAALATSIRFVRQRGAIVQVGYLTNPGTVDISALAAKDITLEGCWYYESGTRPSAIGLVAWGKPLVERAISFRIGRDDIGCGSFEVLIQPGATAVKILIQTNA